MKFVQAVILTVIVGAASAAVNNEPASAAAIERQRQLGAQPTVGQVRRLTAADVNVSESLLLCVC